MKKYYLLWILPLCIAAGALVTAGCSDDNEDDAAASLPPACRITAPANDTAFDLDEQITVHIEAESPDNLVAEVTLHIIDVAKSKLLEYDGTRPGAPCSFTLPPSLLLPGNYVLQATAKDYKGQTTSSSPVNITINSLPESPDVVDFADGQIPDSWEVTDGALDDTEHYNDTYSLKATAGTTTIITGKTFTDDINFVSFYVKGEGTLQFSAKGSVRKISVLTDTWQEYGFYLEAGWYALQWTFNGTAMNLDAVHFRHETQLETGMYYKGGIVYYLDETGQHGLTAAPDDQSKDGIQWYNGTNDYVLLPGPYLDDPGDVKWTADVLLYSAIGKGKSNTATIVQASGVGNYAARLCSDLTLNGYSDWYLPSVDELVQLYGQRELTGGFATTPVSGQPRSTYYWSSSEYSAGRAKYVNFTTGTVRSNGEIKSELLKVRAIREF